MVIQFSIVFLGELAFLYSIRHSRGTEVFVFSHARLVLATAVVAGLSLGFFRLAMTFHPDTSGLLLLYYPAVVVAMLPLVVLQQAAVMLIDKLGSNPIAKDFVRPELHGGDFHSAVIRRFAPFVLLWLLLVPGLILRAPITDWLHYVLLGLWAVPAGFVLVVMTSRT